MASCDLPIDMIINILSRLPSKSVLRFRCVCKSWRHFISGPKFIELHRNLNMNGHVLIQYERNNSNDSIFSLHCDETFAVEQPILELPSTKFDYLGCSNGLVCLSCGDFMDAEFDIYLWNPSIRKLKVLSPGFFPVVLNYELPEVVAIGFVPRINDYRVLKIVHDFVSGEESIFVPKAEIYSLRTNSWKKIDNVIPCHVSNDNKVSRTVNGVVHFFAWEMKPGKEMIIVSFDMADEIFSKIKVREFADFHLLNGVGVCPNMFGEYFWVLCVSLEPRKRAKLHIWGKIKGPGTAESWARKLTIDHTAQPLGFLKNGELVWTFLNKVTSYDPRHSLIKDLPFVGVPRNICVFTEYVESLVLLDQGN